MKRKYYIMYRYASSVCQMYIIANNELDAIREFEKRRKKFHYHHSHFLGCSLKFTDYAWDSDRIEAMRKLL
jgi:hypothetical protein